MCKFTTKVFVLFCDHLILGMRMTYPLVCGFWGDWWDQWSNAVSSTDRAGSVQWASNWIVYEISSLSVSGQSLLFMQGINVLPERDLEILRTILNASSPPWPSVRKVAVFQRELEHTYIFSSISLIFSSSHRNIVFLWKRIECPFLESGIGACKWQSLPSGIM